MHFSIYVLFHNERVYKFEWNSMYNARTFNESYTHKSPKYTLPSLEWWSFRNFFLSMFKFKYPSFMLVRVENFIWWTEQLNSFLNIEKQAGMVYRERDKELTVFQEHNNSKEWNGSLGSQKDSRKKSTIYKMMDNPRT